MTKKTATIILSLILLAISTSLLLVFFVFSNQNTNKDKPLTIIANDLELSVGDKIYNYFYVSEENVEFQFILDKQNIVEINEYYIKGLNIGTVNITIKVSTESKQSQTSFKVTIINNGYTFKIIPLSNCEVINENILNAKSNVCQFSIIIMDKYGNTKDNLKYNYTISDNAELYNEFNSFILNLFSNCVIKLDYYEINEIFEFFVIFN